MTGWNMWEHGQPDSRLTVIKQVDDYILPSGRHEAMWLCECSCEEHNKIIVIHNNLRRGITRSCGCLSKERFIDMTGWVMSEHGVPDSKLTVIKQVDDYVKPNGKREARWLCECSCKEHNTIVSVGGSLRSGGTKSCGCLKVDVNKANLKKYNKRDLSGPYGILWSTNTNEEIYFDLEDAEQILSYCWHVDSTGYPSTSIDRKNVRLHVLLGFKWYDHHNRNKLDNRKENLVKCTRQDNARNTSLQSNNTSGISGVYKSKKDNRWVAQITLDRKTKHIGMFKDKKDAIRARLQAEVKYFGEFAPQRHLFEQYGINATEE